ncbi:acetylxylan esterase [Cutibacterium sp. WCA-380-WT-3A]|uniref:Acetylxylan esterase n=1 Tax=Cutibacterium porci TaxID=2605781 RepID=A0A7K0J4V5_9ACTN|nr:alpha/beta fold hydrolase [Cutibacterium porci]MSS44952.1 acetylxylan esterase [Cutibacterium porci]
MPLTDMDIDEARNYRPNVPEPEDFDSFWAETLDEHAGIRHDLTAEPFDNRQALIDTWDLSWTGYQGSRVRGWLHAPAGVKGPLPLVIEFVGYSGSRGVPIGSAFAAAGYAHIIVDPRGQGWGHPTLTENCPDSHDGSGAPGFMTHSLSDPHGHYYRRLFVDDFRCLQAAREMELIDPTKIVVLGHSQGGGQAIAVSGLAAMRGIKLAGAFVDAPFLCHIRRSCNIAMEGPYLEVVRYLNAHPSLCAHAFKTLGHFDGLHFARRARTASWFSVGMMDQVVPPSSVWAAYNAWGDGMVADKQIVAYPFAGHAAGEDVQLWNQLGVMAQLFS